MHSAMTPLDLSPILDQIQIAGIHKPPIVVRETPNSCMTAGIWAQPYMNTQLSDRCRTSLYRVTFGKPDCSDESVVFLMAGSRDAASRRAMAVLVVLYDIDPQEVHLYNLASFTDLINSGVSDDEDMRGSRSAGRGPTSARGPNPRCS